MKKLFASLIVSLCSVQFVSAVGLGAVNLSDVSGSPYRRSIDWMVENGVVQGYSDGEFRPRKCVNRVELLKVLMLAKEINVSSFDPVDFIDTDKNAWYLPYLSVAYSRGLVRGYPDGSFKPAQCVNRAEAVKMAAIEFLGSRGFQFDRNLDMSEFTYSDEDKNAWYAGYFHALLNLDALGMEHVTDNKFYLDGDMSREEVAEMVYRLKAISDNQVKTYDPALSEGGYVYYSSDLMPKPIKKVLSCVGEGESLGAVVPGNEAVCCDGLKAFIEDGLIGTRGVCVKK